MLADDVRAAMGRYGPRELVSPTPDYPIFVDRRAALFSSWYEFFPRSQGASGTRRTRGGSPARSTPRTSGWRPRPRWASTWSTSRRSTRSAEPSARDRTTRSTPGPADPGSPWAIGAEEGGHDAIHPDLGDFDAFDRFVAKAKSLGLEVAMDFALQASPDHPWVTEHPEWFSKRADGSIAYAENPPKKYQDIYPINFDNDRDGIYAGVLAHHQALDEPRRPDLPRRQSAHQARQLLGMADRLRFARPIPMCCSWPRRSPSRP